MMVWRPFMRQWAQSAKRVRFLGLAFDSGWQEPLNGFAPNSHWRRVWSFARTSWNVKIKSQRPRSPGTKNALCTHNTPTVWTKWNGVVADNVAQAAGASIWSLARGVFAGLHSACGVRWAWRATAGICHAFLVVMSVHIRRQLRDGWWGGGSIYRSPQYITWKVPPIY